MPGKSKAIRRGVLVLLALELAAGCGGKNRKGNSFWRNMCEGNCGQTVTGQEITDNEMAAKMACEQKCRERYPLAEEK